VQAVLLQLLAVFALLAVPFLPRRQFVVVAELGDEGPLGDFDPEDGPFGEPFGHYGHGHGFKGKGHHHHNGKGKESVRQVNQPKYAKQQINKAEYLPPKKAPYQVEKTQHIVENVEQPIIQPVIQPVIQRVIRTPQPVIHTIVDRRVQPVIHRQVQQQLQTVVEEGKAPQAVRTQPKVEEERLAPIIEDTKQAAPVRTKKGSAAL